MRKILIALLLITALGYAAIEKAGNIAKAKLHEAAVARMKIAIRCLDEQIVADDYVIKELSGGVHSIARTMNYYITCPNEAVAGWKRDVLEELDSNSEYHARFEKDAKDGPIETESFAIRKTIITTIMEDEAFLRELARDCVQCVVATTSESTLRRRDKVLTIVKGMQQFAATYDDAAERAWHATCRASLKKKIVALNKDRGNQSEYATLAQFYFFNEFPPGGMRPDVKPDQQRWYNTFLLRRIWSDGMTREQISRVLAIVREELEKIN